MNSRIRRFLISCLLVAPAAGVSLVAQAGPIISGTVADASAAHSGWSPSHLLDQSGLSTTYTSGVTDFAAYLAGGPTHLGSSTSSAAGWFAPGPAWVVVDFGSSIVLGDMILWNDNDYQGVASFSVELADNVNMIGATNLGMFNASYGPSGYDNGTPAQAFDLLDAVGRYARVNFLSAHQGPNINVGEIAFGSTATSVPEPGTLALFGFGLAGIGFMRRRRAV